MSGPCNGYGCPCANHRARVRQVPRLWTPGMDQTLTQLLDRGNDPRRIAVAMHLTEESIRWRTRKLGRSLRDGWRSRQDVAIALGVSRRSVDRWWRSGELIVRKRGTRWTRITDADLETFVKQHAGVLFDPSGIADPTLKRLAETSAVANTRKAGLGAAS